MPEPEPQPESRTLSLDDTSSRTPFADTAPRTLAPAPDLSPPATPEVTEMPEMPEAPDFSEAPAPEPDTPWEQTIVAASGFTRMVPQKPRLRERIWLPRPVPVLIVVLLATAAWVGFNFNRRLETTDQHRAMVLSADRLATFLREEAWVQAYANGFAINPAAERIDVRSHLGGDLSVDYRYEGRGRLQPRLAAHTWVEAKVEGARDTFRVQQLRQQAYWRDLSGGAVVFLELGDECHWGDESYAVFAEAGGNLLGVGFLARQGRVCTQVMLEGVELRNGAELRSLLEPVLSALDDLD